MDPSHATWMFNQHEQARAYWRCLDLAWKRIQTGDAADRLSAIVEFRKVTEAFVTLFKDHAIRENNLLYPEMGRFLTEADDGLVLNIISHFGPADITPYIAIVGEMERALGIGGAA